MQSAEEARLDGTRIQACCRRQVYGEKWKHQLRDPVFRPLVSEDEDFGERERIGMRDGEQRGFPADGGKATGGAAVQLQLRRTAPADHLAIAPEDSAPVARTHRATAR